MMRTKAVEYATQYLGDAGAAEAQRSMAASLISRGRFPEALVALYEARDRIVAQGMPLKGARISMDLADLFITPTVAGPRTRAGGASGEARRAGTTP